MKRQKTALTRRELLLAAMAGAVAGCATTEATGDVASGQFDDGEPFSGENGIRVRFLGCGASGWDAKWAKTKPHMRRQSSLLVENRVLIDFTACSFDKLPKECRPEALFQTHSHGDHYNPRSAVKSGVRCVFVQESWADAAREQIQRAADELGMPSPEVVALPSGQPVSVCGLRITGVPANHSTSRVTNGVLERTSLYLIEKGASRLLYATDTGGIPGDAARMVGIDYHINAKTMERYAGNPFVHEPQPITAFIMEATDGDLDDDFRSFVHSSVPQVERIVRMLHKTGRFVPPAGQKAVLTHLGIKYRSMPAEEIDRQIPDCLRAASDGLELVLG